MRVKLVGAGLYMGLDNVIGQIFEAKPIEHGFWVIKGAELNRAIGNKEFFDDETLYHFFPSCIEVQSRTKIPNEKLLEMMRTLLDPHANIRAGRGGLKDIAKRYGVNYNTLWYAIHERGQSLVTKSEFAQIRACLGGKELRRKYPRYKHV